MLFVDACFVDVCLFQLLISHPGLVCLPFMSTSLFVWEGVMVSGQWCERKNKEKQWSRAQDTDSSSLTSPSKSFLVWPCPNLEQGTLWSLKWVNMLWLQLFSRSACYYHQHQDFPTSFPSHKYTIKQIELSTYWFFNEGQDYFTSFLLIH